MPTKFDFLSPGIQLREIDESQLEPVQEHDGILLIGRARSGPAMKPVKITNLNDFTEIFGTPMDGVRQADPWRDGNTGAPNYAAYAAQAYLASGVGPVKYVRLLGKQFDTTAANRAGWTLGSKPVRAVEQNAAAYGLFVFPSSSASDPDVAANETVNGTLAAVFYMTSSAIGLIGTTVSNGGNGTIGQGAGVTLTDASSSTCVNAAGSNCEFNIRISSRFASANVTSSYTINFDESSPNYIRSVLNTDPTLMNRANTNYYEQSSSNQFYFVGETFDVNVMSMTSASTANTFGVILALKTGSYGWGDFQQQLTPAKSGWLLGNRPNQKKLFRLVALDDGTEFQNQYYGRINNVKLPNAISPTATFSLEIVRRANKDYVVESYSNLNLDKNSSDYVAKRIGDMNESWNTSTGRFDLSGQYPNVSSLVRIEMGESITMRDYPFGWAGPRKINNLILDKWSAGVVNATTDNSTQGSYVLGGIKIPLAQTTATGFLSGGCGGVTGSVAYPTFPLTTAGTKLGGDFLPSDTFGLWCRRSNRLAFNKSYYDLALRTGPNAAISPHLAYSEALSYSGVVFAMDDITGSNSGGIPTGKYFFTSGSYDKSKGSAGSSITKGSGSAGLLDTLRIHRMSFPFFGGADGVDQTLADPFNNKTLSDSTTNSAHYSVAQAMKMVDDPDYIRYDLISMPGLCENVLTDKMITMVNTRADALAVIDIGQGGGIYRPSFDTLTNSQPASIKNIISQIASRQYDTSYACTYFPNVRLKDTLNGNDTVFVAPPSVAAIGAIAKSEAQSQPWFAPAGFNRGGLRRLGGNQGPIVLGAYQHLTKDDRDQLYQSKVNPIARFPATGDTVIFGQKTLQQQASALDRINVRRLMIFLKKRIGDIANTILFDQNLQATWNRFKTRADRVLSEVKADLGISEYKLVLDESTTTPDLIDRNIMYAKIFIKPARAIEFIAIDFVITRTGVEFE